MWTVTATASTTTSSASVRQSAPPEPASPARARSRTAPRSAALSPHGARLNPPCRPCDPTGSGSTFAYGVLDTGYRFDLSKEEALSLAQRSIFAATYRDAYSGGTVRVYHIDEHGWKRMSETDSMDLYYKTKGVQ